jgi:murein L,D-transpeptidase YafK
LKVGTVATRRTGSIGVNPPFARTLLASAAIASAIALTGCETDGTSPLVSARAMQPLSGEMLSLLEQKNMPKESPLLVRLFKEEAELEVWKQDAAGQYALLKTYPICRWSGELGPKIKEGDRQAPEGFYNITPGQMNPNSNYYLSFNLGFPNAFDRAHDRTGAFLMVHGDCSSAGCYAMTDEQMGEIYALGRESFLGGQKSFQVQAYPFRMTPLNMARHRNSPHMAFWRNIKEGNDHFLVTRQEPKVDVCEKRYVFDATTSGRFDSRGKCPAYQVPEEIATPVAAKEQRDEREFASLVSRGTATVAVKTGTDGGMHPVFLARLRPQDKFDTEGRMVALGSLSHVPAMGNNVNPPRTGEETASVAPPSRPGATDTRQIAQGTRVASADAGQPSGSLFGNLFSSKSDQAASERSGNPLDRVGKWFGLRSEPESQAPPPPASKPRLVAEHKTAATARPAAGAIRPAPTQQVAETQKPAPPAPVPPAAVASAAPAPAPASTLMAGAVPVVSSNSFDSRWGAWR